MINIGDVAVDSTVEIPLNTFDGDGSSVTVTDLLNSDVFIYKDQSLTQRTGVSGVAVNINHDGHTGSHSIVIDLSDNDDAGFYVSGSDYKVKIVGATADAQTLNSWVGIFSIENRFMRGTDGANTTKTGFSLSVAGIQAIWDALTAALSTPGSVGKLIVDNLNATISSIVALLPAALVGGRMSSNVGSISTSTDAADKLEASTETIEIGVAIAGTLTTVAMTTNLTETTNDHYNGRTIIWTSGVLLRQATAIESYNGTSKKLTYTAVTDSPSIGDGFIIV